tara:strand:+ start:374 stop:595 length:222 start_codon:yes stop_codon:yes gene_type:complete
VIIFFSIWFITSAIKETPREVVAIECIERVENPSRTELDNLSFNDAFQESYLKHGEGHIFEWNGQLFITKIAK